MRVITNNKGVLFCAIFLGLSASCCSGQAEKLQSNPNVQTPEKPHLSNVQEIRSSKGGRSFLRSEGWPIPQISLEQGQKTTQEIENENKRKIKTDLTDVDLHPFLVTTEPFTSIGRNMGKLQIQRARMYAIRDRAFCYKFLANLVKVDENSNEVLSSSGSLFFFAYYDEDGDGIFETLYLDEIGSLGVPSFFDRPHLPVWTWQRK